MAQLGGGRRKGRQRTEACTQVAVISSAGRDVIVLPCLSSHDLAVMAVAMLRVIVRFRRLAADLLHHDLMALSVVLR
jgi:hypothetical protein